MKEQKRVPQLRFAEFSEDWEYKKLGDIADNVMYGIGAAAKDFDGENKYLRITDIDEVSRRFKPNPLTSPEGVIHHKYYLRKNDIVFARTGASVGKSYLYNESDGVLVFAGFLIKINIKSENSNFVFQHTLKYSYLKWVSAMSMRSGQPGLNAEEYKSLKLNFPSFPEQQKIASFLSFVDKKIEQLQKKKTLLEEYKKGLMQQIFSQQLRFTDKDGNNYPDWEEKRLGEVAKINMGQSPSSSSYNSKGNGIYLIQGNADIRNRKTSPRNWTTEPTKYCEKGDLILTVRAPVGTIAKSIHNGCIGRGVCAIKNKFNSNVEFLYQFLLSYESKWIRLAQGSTFTAVSGNDIKSVKIDFPIKEEQTKIANFLSALDKKIDLINTQIENTQEFKKGLLQQMFV